MQRDWRGVAMLIFLGLVALCIGVWMVLNPQGFRRAETFVNKHPEAHELSTTGTVMYRIQGVILLLIGIACLTAPLWLPS